ncbi:MAG TPA: M48 family peptidase [Chloroflexi bacterium]|nr:M48 family peptidase [Chloroflexota bacterium]
MSGEVSEHIVRYGNTEIKYSLTFKNRKKLAIHVQPDLRVVVEAPLGSGIESIRQKVLKRAAWIIKQQRTFERYSYELPPREYVSGETHRYLGRGYRLKIIQVGEAEPEQVRMDRGRLMIYVRDTANLDRKKDLLEGWYRKHAKRVFVERVDYWLPHFQRYGITSPELTIRRMKSRWGSCTPAGKITLNLKLIQAPRYLLDYIIVHELSHLVELNHNEDYYQLLKRIMPDWEKRREKLNRHEF